MLAGLRVRRGWLAAAVVAIALTAGQAGAAKEALLAVSEGQIPDDTGSDGQTKMTLEEHQALGQRALKVVFAPGDSFGVRVAKVKDWKRFVTLEFEAFNPAQADVPLTLTVKHARTTGYQTRVDREIVLKPGKNSIRIGVDELRNINDSQPDLANVQRWYFACAEGATPTLYLADLWLVGPDAPAPPAAPAAPAGPAPAQAYRVTGKVGDMVVDLTLTPIAAAAAVAPPAVKATPAAKAPPAPQPPATPAAAPASDPARLARIRAAKMPPISTPVPFDTPEADAVLAALEVLPPDNPWNQVVEDWPLHPTSAAIIASIGRDKPMRYNPDMGFVLVPPDQKKVDVKIVEYAGESDPGPYPVPDNVPIEGWPADYQRGGGAAAKLALEDVQRDKANRGGDRHAIVVDPVNRMLYEFYAMRRVDAGWQAQQASIFDLKTNKLRPTGWTSSDAAGLPVFPAVVRYDELKRGLVEHAMRVTVRKTRREFVAPATHFASRSEDPAHPRMGERIRLRKDFDISAFSPEVQAILKGLKKYGMFVADNGIEWAISVAPDPRIPVLHEELRKIKGAEFEVVVPPK